MRNEIGIASRRGSASGPSATTATGAGAAPCKVPHAASTTRLDPRAIAPDPVAVPHFARSLAKISRTAPIVAAVAVACNLVACGTPQAAAGGGGAGPAKPAPAAAKPLEAPPAAVHLPDAPGLNVEDLSARLRIAFARTSGLDVVDDLSVRRELAACTE